MSFNTATILEIYFKYAYFHHLSNSSHAITCTNRIGPDLAFGFVDKRYGCEIKPQAISELKQIFWKYSNVRQTANRLTWPHSQDVSRRESKVMISEGKSSLRIIPRSWLQSSSSMKPNQYITIPGPNLSNQISRYSVKRLITTQNFNMKPLNLLKVRQEIKKCRPRQCTL